MGSQDVSSDHARLLRAIGRYWLKFGVLLLQWLLLCYLQNSLESQYSYLGIAFDNPTPFGVGLSLLALMTVALLLPNRLELPSDIALWWLAVFVVTSTLAVAAANPFFSVSIAINASAAVIVGFSTSAILTRRRRNIRYFVEVKVLSTKNYVAVVLLLTVVGALTVVFGYGTRFDDLSLATVYERRLAARLVADPYPLASYVVASMKAVFAPTLLILGLRLRRLSLAIFSAFALLSIYSYDGQRSALFLPVIALVMYLAVTRERITRNPAIFGFLTVASTEGVPILLTRLIPGLAFDYQVASRMGLVPGLLTHKYVEYAAEFGFTNFSNSWLKYLPLQDTRSMGERVGEWLDPTHNMNANANLWADGYASLGFFGVVVVSLLFVVVLRSMDRLAASREREMASTILAVVIAGFTDSYLHTALLSKGVIVALLAVWVLPAIQQSSSSASSPVGRAQDRLGLMQPQ